MTDLQLQRPELLHSDEHHPAITPAFSDLYFAYKEHKVVNGDSLTSIGEMATKETGRYWSWQDIAKYNWNTTRWNEAMWYMWHHVGCRNVVENKAGTKYLWFNGRETPGIIYMPKSSPALLKPATWSKSKRTVGRMATTTVGAPKSSSNTIRVKPYILLYDTNSGMLYRVPRAMYNEMRKNDKLLRKLQHDMSAAQKAGKDQKNNATELKAKSEEFHKYCGITETDKEKAAGISPGTLFNGEGIIREFVQIQSKEFVYVPAKKQQEIEDKSSFKDRWKKGAVKDALKMRAESRTAKAKDSQTSAMKKKNPLEFKLESSWKAEGEGSLLDMIDTGDPRNCWWLFANPITLPVALMDYVGETFPGFFRKKHGGQWDWAKKSKYFDGGYEARFLRYSYNAQAFELTYNSKDKTFKLGGKAGGTLDLFRGKTHLDWLIPSKEGISANKDLGIPIKKKYSDKDILLRIAVVGTVSGFVGATAELSYEASADWSFEGDADDGSKKCPVAIGIGGGLNAFAGAEVKGELSIAIEWKNTLTNKWAMLARVVGAASGIAGVAVQYTCKIGWDPDKGMFVFEYKMGVALKLGGSGAVKGEVSINEIIELIGAMLEYVDYHQIGCISSVAFEQFTNYIIAMAIEGVESITNAVVGVFDSLGEWWDDQEEAHKLALSINKYGLPKSVKRLGSPEAKGGLIRKLCLRSTVFSDEAEENAVLTIIRSIPERKNKRREMEQVLKSVDPNKRTVQAGVDMIRSLLDWGGENWFDDRMKFFGIPI